MRLPALMTVFAGCVRRPSLTSAPLTAIAEEWVPLQSPGSRHGVITPHISAGNVGPGKNVNLYQTPTVKEGPARHPPTLVSPVFMRLVFPVWPVSSK